MASNYGDYFNCCLICRLYLQSETQLRIILGSKNDNSGQSVYVQKTSPLLSGLIEVSEFLRHQTYFEFFFLLLFSCVTAMYSRCSRKKMTDERKQQISDFLLEELRGLLYLVHNNFILFWFFTSKCDIAKENAFQLVQYIIQRG